jgi:hypothetical protein
MEVGITEKLAAHASKVRYEDMPREVNCFVTWRPLPFDSVQGGEFIEPRLCVKMFLNGSAAGRRRRFF